MQITRMGEPWGALLAQGRAIRGGQAEGIWSRWLTCCSYLQLLVGVSEA